MNRKIIFFLILILNIYFLSACWNYSEVNNRSIIAGIGLDYDEESDKVILTAEIIAPKATTGEESEIDSEIVISEGEDMFDAARNLVSRVGRDILWSHTKICIFGEEFVRKKDKFVGVLDVLKRDAETRDDIFLLLAKDYTAEDILSKVDVKVQNITSFYIEEILKSQNNVPKYYPIELWKFLDNLSEEGVSPTLPTISIVSSEGETHAKTYGTQVFKGAGPIGWLNGNETLNFLMIIDEIEGGLIVVEDTETDKPADVVLEIFESKTKVEPVYREDNIIMKIDIETTVDIAEITGSVDYISKGNMKALEETAEKKVKSEIEDIIDKVQNQYKSDIFGFGSMIHREMPEVWKQIKEDYFRDLRTDVTVKIDIRGSALRSEPIKVSD